MPLLIFHGGARGALGLRDGFSDVAATLADWFGLLEPWPIGTSFLQ